MMHGWYLQHDDHVINWHMCCSALRTVLLDQTAAKQAAIISCRHLICNGSFVMLSIRDLCQ